MVFGSSKAKVAPEGLRVPKAAKRNQVAHASPRTSPTAALKAEIGWLRRELANGSSSTQEAVSALQAMILNLNIQLGQKERALLETQDELEGLKAYHYAAAASPFAAASPSTTYVSTRSSFERPKSAPSGRARSSTKGPAKRKGRSV